MFGLVTKKTYDAVVEKLQGRINELQLQVDRLETEIEYQKPAQPTQEVRVIAPKNIKVTTGNSEAPNQRQRRTWGKVNLLRPREKVDFLSSIMPNVNFEINDRKVFVKLNGKPAQVRTVRPGKSAYTKHWKISDAKVGDIAVLLSEQYTLVGVLVIRKEHLSFGGDGYINEQQGIEAGHNTSLVLRNLK